MLEPKVFSRLAKLWGMPDIDLFASSLNKQITPFVSWKEDVNASFIDAFSFRWSPHFFYAFPPFSMIARCLKKYARTIAKGILIVPNWPTQAWYTKLLKMTIDTSRLLPPKKNFTLPSRKPTISPPRNKHQLIAFLLSERPSDGKVYKKKDLRHYFIIVENKHEKAV
ncbi:hypothetical protein HOLleu_43182 [Holothuria leucospilota]|uniref:Uncharacterized protein n=1 Tax=Holothuria leucospilota TaxID=206669 RepID=A0A9Q0YHA1_HOLLE|nr:hypothetical protein HOLleu_43182 [Holothuria leucospilota]